MRSIDSRTTFEVWQQLIYDESLSASLFDGTYRDQAAQRAFTDEQLAVLEWFATQPGMKWNIENLRFRAALETVAAICIHLPKTARLLSRGHDDWLQDICYEYLSHHRWDALGHHRLTECERFAAYVRSRVMIRRITPQHLEHVLDLELAIIDVLRRTMDIPSWAPPPRLDDDALAQTRPRRGHAQRLLHQPIDLRAFYAGDKLDEVSAPAEPVTWLIHLADPTKPHKLKVIGEGARIVLERCTGDHTVREIAAALEAELELPSARVTQMIRAWIADGILVS